MEKQYLVYGRKLCFECRNSLINRRAAAFVVDFVLAVVGATVAEVGLAWPRGGLGTFVLYCALILLKDSFSGYSPGKALFGIRVLDWRTGVPTGPLESIQRNWVLTIPLMPIIVGLMLGRGERWGDGHGADEGC